MSAIADYEFKKRRERERLEAIEQRTQTNLYRLENNIPLYMEYLGYKFYGKDNWYFAINPNGEWAVGESRSQIKMRVQFKEGVKPHTGV
jgi:hypothetical protein